MEVLISKRNLFDIYGWDLLYHGYNLPALLSPTSFYYLRKRSTTTVNKIVLFLYKFTTHEASVVISKTDSYTQFGDSYSYGLVYKLSVSLLPNIHYSHHLQSIHFFMGKFHITDMGDIRGHIKFRFNEYLTQCLNFFSINEGGHSKYQKKILINIKKTSCGTYTLYKNWNWETLSW